MHENSVKSTKNLNENKYLLDLSAFEELHGYQPTVIMCLFPLPKSRLFRLRSVLCKDENRQRTGFVSRLSQKRVEMLKFWKISKISRRPLIKNCQIDFDSHRLRRNRVGSSFCGESCQLSWWSETEAFEKNTGPVLWSRIFWNGAPCSC